MIRGRFILTRGRSRPYARAHIAVPALNIRGELWFMIDSGSDSTLLASAQAIRLGIDIPRLAPGERMLGIGGSVETRQCECMLTLSAYVFEIPLQILVPGTNAARVALDQIPSVLGRDVLRQFALFLEERTQRVLLLDPSEADRLPL